MNGRIYDPLIGRFMSADPFIQDPAFAQSYNRYAYVMNNPLANIDPSGYWSFKSIFKVFVAVVVAVYAPQIFATYGFTGATVATANLVNAAATGFLVGAITTGTVNGAVQGALTGALFSWAGTVGAGATEIERASSFARYAAHAVAGCVGSAAGGGNCGSGAASALFGKYVSNQLQGWDPKGIDPELAQGVAASVAGGVGSVIAGGKFKNGAETAAFGYLFNHFAHWAELKIYGQEAHKLLQDYMAQRGYVVERSCLTPENCVAGRFDIGDPRLKAVWEIKRNSFFGLAMGEVALDRYTAPETGLQRGGNLIGLSVDASLTLTKASVNYTFTNYGDGLIGYTRWEDPKPQTVIQIPTLLPLPGGSGRRGGRGNDY